MADVDWYVEADQPKTEFVAEKTACKAFCNCCRPPTMNRIISSSEIIGQFRRDEHEFEVCTTGEASFDEAKSQLFMELDSFIRPVNIRAKEQRLPADWLPRKQNLRESVSRADAPALAKDIFHRWAGKVRQSIPLPIHNQ